MDFFDDCWKNQSQLCDKHPHLLPQYYNYIVFLCCKTTVIFLSHPIYIRHIKLIFLISVLMFLTSGYKQTISILTTRNKLSTYMC